MSLVTALRRTSDLPLLSPSTLLPHRPLPCFRDGGGCGNSVEAFSAASILARRGLDHFSWEVTTMGFREGSSCPGWPDCECGLRWLTLQHVVETWEIARPNKEETEEVAILCWAMLGCISYHCDDPYMR